MAEEKSKRAKLYTGSLLTQTEFISSTGGACIIAAGNKIINKK